MMFAPTPRFACTALLATVLVVSAAAAAPAEPPGQDRIGPGRDPIGDAVRSMYNLDFVGAHRVLDAHIRASPLDPAGYSARAAAYMFAEFDRLRILELDFFGDDGRLTDRARLVPDPAVRQKIFSSTAEARRLAGATLGKARFDRDALFAMGMAVGVETQYATLVEKRYIRGGSLSKEAQSLADRMLALQPPIYDAYITLGSIEYVVANLNPVYRLLARLRGLRGGKELAADHLRIVTTRGRYYRPYAKILLAVYYSREAQLVQARSLLEDLRQDFPDNSFFAREVARIDAKIAAGGR